MALVLALSAGYAFASPKGFTYSTDKTEYGIGTDVYVYVSGPAVTSYTVNIYGPGGVLAAKKTDKTSSTGSSYMRFSGFASAGEYRITLDAAGANVTEKHFTVLVPGTDVCVNCKPAPRVTTTTSTTSGMLPTTTKTTAPFIPATRVSTTTDESSKGLYTVTAISPASTKAETSTSMEYGTITTDAIQNLKTKKSLFSLSEEPEFELTGRKGLDRPGIKNLRQNSSEEIAAHLEDMSRNLLNITPEIVPSNEGYTIRIPNRRAIRPGRYVLVVETPSGQESSSFDWGLVSVNTHKSIYLPGETAHIGMAVLDSSGHMVCDANVTLTIKDPQGIDTVLSTENGRINVSDQCRIYGVTDRPDYYAEYITGGPGTYWMNLSADTLEGTIGMTSNFSVEESVDFDIARYGPTRIYPPANYNMTFVIVPKSDYDGKITEYVPSVFDITPQEGLIITESGDTKTLTWNGSLPAGETTTLYYEFKAPDISPYLYNLGPLTLGNFSEKRQWMIASDAPIMSSLSCQQITCIRWGSVAVSCTCAQIAANDATYAYNNGGIPARRGDPAQVNATYNTTTATIPQNSKIKEVNVTMDWHVSTSGTQTACTWSFWNSTVWSTFSTTCRPTSDYTESYNLTSYVPSDTAARNLAVKVSYGGQNVNSNDTLYVDWINVNVTYNPPPVINNTLEYNSTLGQKSVYWIGDTVRIRANVTDGAARTDIKNVTVNIIDPQGTVRVNNASMINITQIANGYVYEYNYTTMPSSATSLGNWQVWIFANDTDQLTDHNYTNFTVINPLDEVLYNYTQNVTRSYPGITYLWNLSGYVNNTNSSTQTNVWLNWTLPSGWTNVSGSLSKYTASMATGAANWSNISVNLSTQASLGPVTIQLAAYSDTGNDSESVTVYVYADTNTTGFSTNSTNPVMLENITLKAQLLYDNGTNNSGRNVSFYDQTAGTALGNATTNTTGWATLYYQIPSTATTGAHTLNATYNGSGPYLNPSGSTLTLNVYIQNNLTIWDEADTTTKYVTQPVVFYANYTNITGYPINTTIAPDVSCNVTIYNVTYWTSPINMAYNSTTSLYRYNMTGGLNHGGIYNYNITCNATGYLGANASSTLTITSPPQLSYPVTYNTTSLANNSEFKVGSGVKIRVNVTDDSGRDDLKNVTISLQDPTGNMRVINDSMLNVTQITNGYTYEYNYTAMPAASASYGQWNVTVNANTTEQLTGYNSTNFTVLAFQNLSSFWWNDSWGYRQAFNITNGINQNLTFYQVSINLNSSNTGSNLNWATDANSTRLTYWNPIYQNESALNFWIEYWNTTTDTARIWMNMTLIPANETNFGVGNGTARIYFYYGNPSASSLSNGTLVFNFFDDFPGTSLDGRWTATSPANVIVNDSRARINQGDIYTTNAINSTPQNYTFEAKLRYHTQAADYAGLCIANASSTSGSNGGKNALAYIMTEAGAISTMTLWGADGTVASSYNIVSDGSVDSNLQNENEYTIGYDFRSNSQMSYFEYNWSSDAQIGRNTYPGTWNQRYWLWLGTFTGSAGASADIDDMSVDWVRVRKYASANPSVSMGTEEYGSILNASMDQPAQNSVLTRLQPFTMNGSVNCTNGNCGSVNSWAQYLTMQTPTFTWTESSFSDFNNYNESTNISITTSGLALGSLNPGIPWWDTSWIYRQEFNLSNIGGNMTDQQVMIRLNSSNVGSSFNWTVDRNATRWVWYNSSNSFSTELPFWIESYNETAMNATMWVKMPFLLNGTNTTIHLYYGNPGVQSTSNGGLTFNFFDDFDGTSLDSKWTVSANDYSVGNSTLRINVGAVTLTNPLSFNLNDGYILEGRMLFNNLEAAYGGTLSAQSSQYTQSGNGGADATSLYMRESGSRNLGRYTGTGSGASYDCSNTPLIWTSADNYWYVLSAKFNAAGVNLSKDRATDYAYGCGWTKNLKYISFGYFAGGAGSAIQDTSYDWVLVRKYVTNEPTFKNGSEQLLSLKSQGQYVSNPFDSSSTDVQYKNIYWGAVTNANTSLKVYTRTSTDNITWGSWWEQTNNSQIYAENYRYVEYKVLMASTNSKQTPYYGKNTVEYKISTTDWASIQSSGTALTTSNPYGCGGLNQTNKTCYPVWSINPKQVGNYSIRIYANSSINTASRNASITVMANTNLISFAPNQSSVGRGRSAQLTARLLDDLSQPMSGYNMTFYDMTQSTLAAYNYNTYPAITVPGQKAYVSVNAGSSPPGTGPEIQNEVEFNAANYSSINASDNIFAEARSNSQPRTHRFQFNVTNSVPYITSIYFYWEGKHEDSTNVYLLLWNYNTAQWDLLNSATIGPAKANLSYTLTSGFTNYINSTGQMQMAAEGASSFGTKNFSTDYAYVNITSLYIIGSSVTDSNGYASLIYNTSASALLGSHSLNATYNGNPDQFLNPSAATSSLFVSSVPQINNVSASPQTVGFGYPVEISANVTDDVGIDKVKAYVTGPYGTLTALDMVNYSGIYRVNYTDTWLTGAYYFYIDANNTDGISNQFHPYFYVNSTASMKVETQKTSYKVQENVYLSSSRVAWMYSGFSRRVPVTVQENSGSALTNYQTRLFVPYNTQMNSNYSDLRFTYYNSSSGVETALPYWIENYTATNATVWVNVTYLPSGGTSQLYMYYGNPSASSQSNGDAVFIFFDDFPGASINATKWNIVDATGWSVANGMLQGTSTTGRISSVNTFTWPIVQETRTLMVSPATNGEMTAGFWTSAGDGFGLLEHSGGTPSQYWYRNDGNWPGPYNYNTFYDWHLVRVTASSSTTASVYINDSVTGNAATNSDTNTVSGETITLGRRYDDGFTPQVYSQFWDWMRIRKYASTEPVPSFGNEEKSVNGLTNTGSQNFTGYLWMIVQKNVSGSWTFLTAVVNDRAAPVTLRTVNVNQTLNVSKIWNDAGGWYTGTSDTGQYRVYAEFTDSGGNCFQDSNGNYMNDSSVFNIIPAQLQLTQIEHENQFEHSINQYEVGDTISWINITVTAYNSTALNTNVTLNLLDSTLKPIGWGPNETINYGDIAENQSSEKEWNNSNSGYAIPLNATPGTYNFYWNVSMVLKNGPMSANSSLSFTIHNLTAGFISNLTPQTLFKPNMSWYNFTFTNPWGAALTGVNITVNCPSVTNLTCQCGIPGQSGSTCNIGTVGAGAMNMTPFNISVKGNTPNGDYDINVTIRYVNPGNEVKQWSGMKPQTLRVRSPGLLLITIYSFPTNITRGASANFSAYMNDTSASSATNAWLNYTLPTGWTNTAGALQNVTATLCPGCIAWNNITVSVGASSSLGPQQVRLDSSSDQEQRDWATQNVVIYANTSVNNYVSNDTIPNRGDTITLQANLYYDNGLPVQGENITFWDQNQSTLMGSALTDAGGLAQIAYQIPANFALGGHYINATYNGSSTVYTRPSATNTSITVHAKPTIQNVTATPATVGFGYNVTIRANITDQDDGISKAYAYVTMPNNSVAVLPMTISGGNYTVDFSSTWKIGTYSFYLWANDTIGSITTSPVYQFYVSMSAAARVKTVNDSYSASSWVNLTTGGGWWNSNWNNRRNITVNETSGSALYNYQIQINITYNSSMNADYSDLRFTYYNVTTATETKLPYWIENYTASNATIWVNVSSIPASGKTTIYMYYGNPSATSESNGDTVFNFLDTFEGSSVNTTKWNIVDATGWSVGSGMLRGQNNQGRLRSMNTFSWPLVLEARTQMVTPATNGEMTLGFFNSTSNAFGLLEHSGGAPTQYWYNNNGGWTGSYNYNTFTDWHYVKITASGVNTVTLYMRDLVNGNSDTRSDSNNIANETIGLGERYDDAIVGQTYDNYWDWVRIRQYASSEPVYSMGSEETVGSIINNLGAYNTSGFLVMQVQYNNSGTWQTVATVINDTSRRNISAGGTLSIGSIWNAVSWNTAANPAGLYRVYAALTDADKTILVAENGPINATYNFNITGSAVQLNITEIRIYNVTGNPNTHTFIGNLIWAGTNTNFTLYTGQQYRVEVKVYNLIASSTWFINSSNASDINLNSSWFVNQTNDIWYSNTSTRGDTNFQGGNYSNGTVFWNASKAGSLQPGGNATFYYVFNITTNQAETRQVNFNLNDPTFIKNDYSNYIVNQLTTTPPGLWQNIYNLTSVNVTRGNSLSIYAKWERAIGNATAEYNSTTPTLTTYNIAPPYTENWTNYTMSTTSLWILGVHSAKIYAADIAGNWNNTLGYLNYTVWGNAQVTGGSINASTISQNDTIQVSCLVKDSTNNSIIPDYVVHFYNATSELGTNATNSSGWATYSYRDTTLGTESITCNITQNASRYYLTDNNNYMSFPLTTKEYQAPWYSNVGPANGTAIHKNDSTNIYALWNDNYLLDKSWLETNETGAWQNKTTYGSPATLSGSSSWSNYTWTNPSFTPGRFSWRIYANDSFGNVNVTGTYWLDVWGWSEISYASLTNEYITTGQITTMLCGVRDANSLGTLGSYPVYFYNSTGLMGINSTNASGWASWTFNDTTAGDENITCNITDNSTLRYNKTQNNAGSDILHTTAAGGSPPSIFNNLYGLNATDLYRGDSVYAYAKWNQSLSNATIDYNSTSSTINTYQINPPYTENWTNYTITTDSSWALGGHVVKIRAAGQNGVWNNTLNYLNYTVWGRAGVAYMSPTGQINRGLVNLSCSATDLDTGQPISGYWINYYDSGYFLGSNQTNASGIAMRLWDATTSGVGPHTIQCQIANWNEVYYKATQASDSKVLTLYGRLNATLTNPQNASIYYKGGTVSLNSTINDELGNPTTPDSATWYNSSIQQIATGKDTTWQIPVGYKTGPETINLTAAKQYYYSDSKNVSINIWGWANISQAALNPPVIPPGGSTSFGCLVVDANSSSVVQNYPVYFYNSTSLMGAANTGSDGWAYYTYADSAGVNMSLTCNISDNATIFYNDTANNGYRKNVTINPNPPIVQNETRRHPANIHYNDPINVTVDAYSIYLDKVWVKLYRPQTMDYINVRMYNLAGNTYNLSSSSYSYQRGPWNATFYANDTSGNQNVSATTLNWTVWGYSNVTWISPQPQNYTQGTTINLSCSVKDVNTSAGIANYTVNYYYKNSTQAGYTYINTTGANQTGYANYNWPTTSMAYDNYTIKCNITDNSSTYYNVTSKYEANTTIGLIQGGYLEANLTMPLTNTTVGANRTFVMNATVTCRNISCGTVTGTARYNFTTQYPDTNIQPCPASPFCIVTNPNPQSCPAPLAKDESCTLNWTVNATGTLDQWWAVGVNFASQNAGTALTNSSLIKTSVVLILTTNSSYLDWDLQSPGTNCTPDVTSPKRLRITLDPNSNYADGIYLKATDLVNASNKIGPGNITWCENCGVCSNGARASSNWQLIRGPITPGTDIYMDYWLDIPIVYYGRYAGEMDIMANASY